jgi:hypothetical protein
MIFFCDLLWFFKDSDEINLKEKYKTTATVAKPPSKTAQGVIWPVLQNSGSKLDRFIVEGVN